MGRDYSFDFGRLEHLQASEGQSIGDAFLRPDVTAKVIKSVAQGNGGTINLDPHFFTRASLLLDRLLGLPFTYPTSISISGRTFRSWFFYHASLLMQLIN